MLHKEADLDIALDVIINAKTAKISACNALDKVLIDENLPNKEAFIKTLISKLKEFDVEILGDKAFSKFENVACF